MKIPDSGKRKELIQPDYSFLGTNRFYSGGNYLGPTFLSRLKCRHFQRALDLAPRGDYRAMDYGCGDGFFLPTLSHYYREVYAIDLDPEHIDIANRLIRHMALDNTAVYHVSELDRIRGKSFDIIFCLETLEHIPEPDDILESFAKYLGNENNRLIFSVPLETGFSFLLKYLYRWCSGRKTMGYSWRDIFMTVLGKTGDIAHYYGHRGFNHRVLLHTLELYFTDIDLHHEPFPLLGSVLNRGIVGVAFPRKSTISTR